MDPSTNTDSWVRILQIAGFLSFLSMLAHLTEFIIEISGFLRIVVEYYRDITSPAVQMIRSIVEFLTGYEISRFTADYILFGLMFSGVVIRKLLWGVSEVPYTDLVDTSRHSDLYIKTVMIGVTSVVAIVLYILFSLLWPVTLPNMILNYLLKKPTLTWGKILRSYNNTVKWHGDSEEVRKVYEILLRNINIAITSSSKFIVNSTIVFLILVAINQSVVEIWAINLEHP